MQKHKHKAETLEKAFEKADNLKFENGMATFPVIVERNYEKVKVIRKCGNLEKPEHYLIIATPKQRFEEPNLNNLNDDILEALGYYGDLKIQFKSRRNSRHKKGSYTAIINT